MGITCPKCDSLGEMIDDAVICSNKKCKHEWSFLDE